MPDLQSGRPPRFMHPDAFFARAAYLKLRLDGAMALPTPEKNPFARVHPGSLLEHAEHGSITGACLDSVNGQHMVGLSFLGEKPRFLTPLDSVAISLALAFGLPLTLQKTGGGFAYTRFRANMPGEGRGQNIYLLRVLADAQPWQTVKHLDPLAALRAEAAEASAFDHHYLGRDALQLRSVREVWAEGKASRVPSLGREDLITAALYYYDRNAVRSGLSVTRRQYDAMLRCAFILADWFHGRADGLRIAPAASSASIAAAA